MKKNYIQVLSLVFVALCGLQIQAQVSAYFFSQNLITYNAISGGTVFGTTTSDDDYFCNPGSPQLNQNTGPGIPIGFNFTFNGTVYDCFGISNNGWIFFGQSTLTPNPVNGNSSSNYTGLSATSTAPAALQNRVAGLARDLQAQAGSALRVETIGSTPNRTCVVQWSNYRKFGGTGDLYNFQIRLIETNNIVDVIYGGFINGATAGVAEVGLRGNTNADFNNRVVNTTNTWSVSVPGTVNTNSVNFTTTLVPQSGLAYRWLAPIPCSGIPSTTAVAGPTLMCPGGSALLLMNNSYNSYTNTGVSFQWYSASSVNGPYSAVNGATNTAFIAPNILGTTYFMVVPTCSVGPVSATATPAQVNVGAPAISNAVSNLTLVCPGNNVALSLSSPYTGVSYQWLVSTTSSVGIYSAVPNATLATYTGTNLNVTTWYQAIVSCTSSPSASVTTMPVEIDIAGTVVKNIPYYENFEGIALNNQLPNCSWSASSPTTICQTYTTANTLNRIPHTGQKFATFRNATNVNGDFFYSNGLNLLAGVTYSAAAWYITDGNVGWSEFSLLVGSAQSSVGLSSIASVTGAVTGQFYQLLGGTFSVNTSGVYYIAVKCIGNATPQYLTWDDLSVTIPCQLNSPTITVTGMPNPLCEGAVIGLSASGADTYTWSNGVTSSTAIYTVQMNSNFSVMGTNALSGCTSSLVIPANINPAPPVGIIALSPSICAGSSATLTAFGANSYLWSNGATGPIVVVTPSSTSVYTVTGMNSIGCTADAFQIVVVNQPPVIIINSISNTICVNESATLTAFGAVNFEWKSNSIFIQANPAVLSPTISTSFTVTGTDAKGCKDTAIVNLVVDPCVGLNERSITKTNVEVYPNPAKESIAVKMNTTSVKTIFLTDISGRVLSIATTGDTVHNFDLNGLSAGVYFVKIHSPEGPGEIKFVKQ